MPRGGSLPGERRGGRKKGTPNKATRELREIAGVYTEEAVGALAEIMRDKRYPAIARVGAANGLLDRAHGKPRQGVDIQGSVTLEQLVLGSLKPEAEAGE